MRLFHHIVLAVFALFFALSPARAEEPRFAPQVDVSAIKSTNDVYHAEQWANSRRYERRMEVDSDYYDKKQKVDLAYYEKRMEALKKVRSANRTAYLEWLDAREMMDFDRIHEIEKSTPEFQSFLAEDAELESVRDQELAALEAERDSVVSEIDAVYETEVSMIEQAYEKIKTGL